MMVEGVMFCSNRPAGRGGQRCGRLMADQEEETEEVDELRGERAWMHPLLTTTSSHFSVFAGASWACLTLPCIMSRSMFPCPLSLTLVVFSLCYICLILT